MESPEADRGTLWTEALAHLAALAPPRPRLPKLKLNDRGKPQRLPASHIMRRDADARAAYEAMRRRGISRQEAETEIEVAVEGVFHEVLLAGIDRRLEIWISLEEGRRARDLFEDINIIMDAKFGESDDVVQPAAREARVRLPGADD